MERRTIEEARRRREWWEDRAILEELRALKKTRALMIDPKRWTTAIGCVSEAGNIVVPWSRRATEWSLAAAMVVYQRYLNNLWNNTKRDAVVRLLGGRSFWDVVIWSEASHRTHEEVISLLDDAIAMLAIEYAESITEPLFGRFGRCA